MAYTVMFDTETTGADTEDKIIQVGSMIFNTEDSNHFEVFNEMCNTDTDIKFGAMAVHHITPEMIEDKPMFSELGFNKRVRELNEDTNYLVAHNINFDLTMIEKEDFSNNYKLIDTLRVAQHLLPNEESHALQRLRYSLGLYKEEKFLADKLDITISAHDAISDVLVMKLLFDKLSILCDLKLNELGMREKFSNELYMNYLTTQPVLVKKFKFGKYKDRLIEDIAKEDLGYMKWMRNNMADLDENMKFTLDKFLKN